MRTVSEIYEEYKIYSRLQNHMLQVAAVASMICDSLNIPVDKESVLTAALAHDMGNIIKSHNLNYWNDFSREELEYWENVKREFIEKYGTQDHPANVKIAKEIGLSEKAITLIDNNKFEMWCEHAEGKNFEAKILIYADGRVSPNGVVSYEERMEEAGKRYKGHSNFADGNRERLVGCGRGVEKELFSHSKIKPEDITDEAVASLIEELENFVVK